LAGLGHLFVIVGSLFVFFFFFFFFFLFYGFCSGTTLSAGIGAAPSSGSKVDEPGFIGFCLSTLVYFRETERYLGLSVVKLLRRF
jgi:hypothetical protein